MAAENLGVPSVFDVENYLYFHEENLLSRSRTALEVAFILKALRLERGLSLLDVACGHGRHATELAQHVGSVTGVDVNGDFIEIAERNVAAS